MKSKNNNGTGHILVPPYALIAPTDFFGTRTMKQPKMIPGLQIVEEREGEYYRLQAARQLKNAVPGIFAFSEI